MIDTRVILEKLIEASDDEALFVSQVLSFYGSIDKRGMFPEIYTDMGTISKYEIVPIMKWYIDASSDPKNTDFKDNELATYRVSAMTVFLKGFIEDICTGILESARKQVEEDRKDENVIDYINNIYYLLFDKKTGEAHRFGDAEYYNNTLKKGKLVPFAKLAGSARTNALDSMRDDADTESTKNDSEEWLRSIGFDRPSVDIVHSYSQRDHADIKSVIDLDVLVPFLIDYFKGEVAIDNGIGFSPITGIHVNCPFELGKIRDLLKYDPFDL